jgi:hypothetical protein
MIHIYVLLHPQTREVRYVGRSFDPAKRLGQHIGFARAGLKTWTCYWIRGLLRKGLSPQCMTIESCDESVWKEAEMFWIAYFTFIGAKLTNATAGGDGITHPKQSVREAMSRLTRLRNTGVKFTDERKRKIGEAHKGKTLSAEHRAILSAVNRLPRCNAWKDAQRISIAERRAQIAIDVEAAKSSGMDMRALLSGGASLRFTAKVLGVSHQTISARLKKCA